MKLLRRLAVLVLIVIFLFGLGVLLYPYIEGYLVDKTIQNAAQDFLSWVEITPYVPDSSGSHVLEPGPARPAIPEPTEPSEYGESSCIEANGFESASAAEIEQARER